MKAACVCVLGDVDEKKKKENIDLLLRSHIHPVYSCPEAFSSFLQATL